MKLHEEKLSEYIRANYKYDPTTGTILFKDKAVKTSLFGGYKDFNILGDKFLVHRVIWFLHYGHFPENELDHIDRDKTNNCISNLRECTRSQNILLEIT